ncbi:MAG: hypothetical protein V7672_00775 [Brevundimonas sp.]|uniref:hypothetical protein n=1 Tax=Brevundimonas sp. TaxID=1871086 RepID=UPI0030011B96
MTAPETIIDMDLASRPDENAFIMAEPGDDGFRYRAATNQEIADHIMREQERQLDREGRHIEGFKVEPMATNFDPNFTPEGFGGLR